MLLQLNQTVRMSTWIPATVILFLSVATPISIGKQETYTDSVSDLYIDSSI